MSSEEPLIPDNPRAALQALLIELENDYYPFYEKAVSRLYWVWFPIHIFSLFSGFTTAILAALTVDEFFAESKVIRIFLILLPAFGAAASTLIVQSRMQEFAQLREKGRREILSLINHGRGGFAKAQNNEEYSAIHQNISERLDEIEGEQAAGFFANAAGRPHPSKD